MPFLKRIHSCQTEEKRPDNDSGNLSSISRCRRGGQSGDPYARPGHTLVNTNTQIHKYKNIQAQTTHYNTTNTFTQIGYIQVEWPLLLDRVPHLVTVGISPILCHPRPGSWKGKVPKLSKCSLLKFGLYFIQAKIHNDVAIVDDEYASARSGAGNIFHDALCSGEESRMHEVQKETGYFRTSHTTHSPTTPLSTLMHPS